MAYVQAITAVGTVHFVRTRPHFACTQASVAIVAGARLIYAEKGNFTNKFHRAADRTDKTAPEVGNNERSRNQRHDHYGTYGPIPIGKANGHDDRIKILITRTHRNHDPRVIKTEVYAQADKNCNDHADLSEPHALIAYLQLCNRQLAEYLIDKTARTEPAAKGTAQEDGKERYKEPKTEEICRNTPPTGDDGTSLTIDEGNNKGTSENPVVYPFTHNCKEYELY